MLFCLSVCLFFFLQLLSNLCFILQAITASSTKKNDLIFGEIQSQLKNKNVTVDVKANSDSNVSIFVVVIFRFSGRFLVPFL